MPSQSKILLLRKNFRIFNETSTDHSANVPPAALTLETGIGMVLSRNLAEQIVRDFYESAIQEWLQQPRHQGQKVEDVSVRIFFDDKRPPALKPALRHFLQVL